MSMEMEIFVVGPIDVNCYVISDSETRHGMVIDPGGSGEKILRCLEQDQVQLDMIVNTHAHADHIGAVDFLREKTGAPLCVHELEAPLLIDSRKNLSAFMGYDFVTKPADRYLQDDEEIRIGNLSFRVIATPGHSPGGICLYGEGALFSGDSLFQGSIGRCDFPGSSEADLVRNLLTRILPLPGETKVFPGHGPASSIAWEKKYNPYLVR